MGDNDNDDSLQNIKPMRDTDDVVRHSTGRGGKNPTRYGDWIDSDGMDVNSSSEVEGDA